MSAVLVARCENITEPDGFLCPGLLRYEWGQVDAACDTCGGRCGIAVASWERVELARAVPDTGHPTAEVLEAVRELAQADVDAHDRVWKQGKGGNLTGEELHELDGAAELARAILNVLATASPSGDTRQGETA